MTSIGAGAEGGDGPAPNPWVFWPLAVVGIGIMAIALAGLVQSSLPLRLVATWTVGLALVHDLVLAPAVVAVGFLVARVVPPTAKAPVQSALFATAVIVGFAAPLVRRYGAVRSNPSILPWDYTTTTLSVLAVVWLAAAVWFGLRLRRAPARRTSGRPRPPRP